MDVTILPQEELLTQINTCLGRSDLTEVEFTILHSLKYLILTQSKTIVKE